MTAHDSGTAVLEVAVEQQAAARRWSGARLARWGVLFVLAWLALTFLLRDPLHYLIDWSPQSFGRFWPNRPWLLVHIVAGVIAVLVGPLQFIGAIQRRIPALHRWTGRCYISAILLAGGSAFFLAFFAEETSFAIALLALATAWWLTTGAAFLAIRQRRIPVHRRWMTRSYIVTFAFVTFRLLGTLPFWAAFGIHREAAAAWVSWVVPILVAEFIFRRTPAALPADTFQRSGA